MKAKYEPLGLNDELSMHSAFAQAASALDVAIALAVESRDIEQLSSLSVIWMELASRLSNGGLPAGSESDQEDPEFHRHPLGFTAELREEE